MDKVAMLSQILAEHPNDAFARYGLAMALVSDGRVPDALREFDKCIELSPDYVPAYQMSAQTMAADGDKAGAVARLHHGIIAAMRMGNQHARDEMEALRDDLTGE